MYYIIHRTYSRNHELLRENMVGGKLVGTSIHHYTIDYVDICIRNIG